MLKTERSAKCAAAEPFYGQVEATLKKFAEKYRLDFCEWHGNSPIFTFEPRGLEFPSSLGGTIADWEEAAAQSDYAEWSHSIEVIIEPKSREAADVVVCVSRKFTKRGYFGFIGIVEENHERRRFISVGELPRCVNEVGSWLEKAYVQFSQLSGTNVCSQAQ